MSLRRLSFQILPALLCLLSGVALASPVTPEDFSGKSICWTSKVTGKFVAKYGADGHYSSKASGDGTWVLASGELKIDTERRHYVSAIQKMPDGTFKSHTTIGGVVIYATGKYCE